MALFFTEGLATLFLWLSCRGSPQTTRQGAGSFRGALGDSNEVVPFTAAAAIMRLGKISSAQDYWCAERPAIG